MKGIFMYECQCGAVLNTDNVFEHFRKNHPSVYMDLLQPIVKEHNSEFEKHFSEVESILDKMLKDEKIESFYNEYGEICYRLKK